MAVYTVNVYIDSTMCCRCENLKEKIRRKVKYKPDQMFCSCILSSFKVWLYENKIFFFFIIHHSLSIQAIDFIQIIKFRPMWKMVLKSKYQWKADIIGI